MARLVAKQARPSRIKSGTVNLRILGIKNAQFPCWIWNSSTVHIPTLVISLGRNFREIFNPQKVQQIYIRGSLYMTNLNNASEGEIPEIYIYIYIYLYIFPFAACLILPSPPQFHAIPLSKGRGTRRSDPSSSPVVQEEKGATNEASA